MTSRLALTALLALSTVPLRAEEPPQVRNYRTASGPNTAGQMTAKVTYCGIGTSEVSPALSSHLKIPAAMGLIVDWVEPGSPAEHAGIKQYDVLMKFNDQKLVNPEQLRTLVRLKRPSDDVKFELIRQGQPTTANVELGQAERAEAPTPQPTTVLRDTFHTNVDAAPGHAANANVFYQRAVPGLEAPLGGGFVTATNINGQNQTQWADDQHSLRIERSPNKPLHLIARDKAGKELFNGPVETPEQLKALPPDLAAKLSRAQQTLPMTVTARSFTAGGNVMINALGENEIAITNQLMPPAAVNAARARVLTSTQKENLLIARFENAKANHLLAFNTSTGKTLFDGPVATPEQRKSLPAALAEQLDVLEKNQSAAPEFGTVGR